MSLGISVLHTFGVKDTSGVRLKLVEFTGDNAFATGGYAIAASDLSVTNGIKAILPCGVMGTSGNGGTGLGAQWDRANGKLKLYKGNGTSAFQEAAAGDPNGLKLLALAIVY